MTNTTVESFSGWIAERLREMLAAEDAGNITHIRVEVEESYGQSAVCRLPVALPDSSELDE